MRTGAIYGKRGMLHNGILNIKPVGLGGTTARMADYSPCTTAGCEGHFLDLNSTVSAIFPIVITRQSAALKKHWLNMERIAPSRKIHKDAVPNQTRG